MSRYLNFEPTLPLPLCQNSYYVTTKVKERYLTWPTKKSCISYVLMLMTIIVKNKLTSNEKADL